MDVTDNEVGGKTVSLAAGDDLRQVPRSHRGLVTADVRAVFRDPPGYFARVAERTPFPRMADWLQALLWENRWTLELHRVGLDPAEGWAGFRWSSDTVRGAEIGLPTGADTRRFPKPLADLFGLVGSVSWGGAGSVGQATATHLLTAYDFEYRGDPIDPGRTAVWGGQNGDMLVADLDHDRGGWVGLGWHNVRMLGTVAETVDWVFAELLAGRGPSMDPYLRPGEGPG